MQTLHCLCLVKYTKPYEHVIGGDTPCFILKVGAGADMGNKGGKLVLTDTIVENISVTSGLGNSVRTEN